MASAINSVITNNGVENAILAQAQQGFFVRISSFGVSEIAGVLSKTRDTANTEWFKANVSSIVKVGQDTVRINCNIPPQSIDLTTGLQVVGTKQASEIYLYALDQNDNEYLFAIGQPEFTELYSSAASLTLRISITLQNSNTDNVYQFLYTQANEIFDHNNDPNAHPLLQAALEKHGIYDQELQRIFNGQQLDAFPHIDGSVTNLKAVYWDSTSNTYKMGLFDGTSKENVIGVYSSVRNSVIFSGVLDYTHSYAPYTNLFLSPTSLGDFSDAVTDILIGYALPNNKIFINTQDVRKRVGADGGGSASFPVNQNGHGFLLLDGIYFDGSASDPSERRWKLAKADSETTLATHLVTSFNATLPNVFTATKFGRDLYDSQVMKSQGQYYYLSPFYGVDLEVLALTNVAITVGAFVPIILSGATLEDRAMNLAVSLEALSPNFRATAIGRLVHFETDIATSIVTTDSLVLRQSSSFTRIGYATPVAPTEGFDNPLFYVETRNAIHSMMHRPNSLGGSALSPSSIGQIEQWGAGSDPYGLLLCNGAKYKIEFYPELYAEIGTTYNNGTQAVDEFMVPNIPNQVINTKTYSFYIRHTKKAAFESDMALFKKNPVHTFGSVGSGSPSIIVNSDNFRYFKTEITSNVDMSLTNLRPGRKFNLSIRSLANVSLIIRPSTNYSGVTDIQIRGISGQATVNNAGANKTYTLSLASEEKLVEVDCFLFGTVLYIYFKAQGSWVS